jgi:hypothetical protein
VWKNVKVLWVLFEEKSLAYPNRLKIRGWCTIVGWWFKLDVYLKPLTLQEEREGERERGRKEGFFLSTLGQP